MSTISHLTIHDLYSAIREILLSTPAVVTQTSSAGVASSTVVCNARKGIISTSFMTASSGVALDFVVSNSYVGADDIILVQPLRYVGTSVPAVSVDSVSSGFFRVRVTARQAGAVMNDSMTLGFLVF